MVRNMPAAPPTELISAAAIAARVTAMGQEIDRTLRALAPAPLTVVGVLRGAFIFMSDLVRAVPRDMTCEFLGVRSYGDATVSSGVVEITHDLMAPIAGRHVLLVEDIVDTGLTLRYLLDLLNARGPASIHTAALLRKKLPQSAALTVDFVGFEAPNAFLVGYGLDAAQLYRNLPYIGAIET
jgi:hypoxanthine phosphoribosyltransferase